MDAVVSTVHVMLYIKNGFKVKMICKGVLKCV